MKNLDQQFQIILKLKMKRIFNLLQQYWNSNVNIRPTMKEIIQQLKQVITP